MSRPQAAKRLGSRTSGTNTLITAASLALTLSGWAVIADREAEPAPPVAVAQPAPTSEPLPSLPAVPTLLPTPDWDRIDASIRAAAAQSAPTAAPVAPTRAVVAPPPRAAAAPPARPPRPAAVTRSSR